MLLDGRILPILQIMKKINPECGLLLSARCLTMTTISTKIACLCIPTIVYGMDSLIVALKNKKNLI
jgi:hypothetical protein